MRMGDVFVTGATGLIGGEIVIRLVRQGCERVWCLTRGASEEQARQRLRRRLLLPRASDPQVTAEEIDLDRRVRVVRGDFNLPHLGIAPDLGDRLRAALTAIIHCGAELSFDDSADCYAANCEGLVNVLEFAADCPRALYVHFSSAACCGRRPDEVIREERPPLARDAHFNQYTHSKALGEALATAHDRLRTLVIRPPLTLPDAYTDRRLIRSIMWALSVISRMEFIPVAESARTDLVGVSFVAEATLALVRKYPDLMSDCYHVTAGPDWAISPRDVVRIAREELGKTNEFKLARSTAEGSSYLQNLTEAEQKKLVNAATTFLPFFNANMVYDNRRLTAEVPAVFGHCEPPASFMPRLVKLYHLGHTQEEVSMLMK
jgi:nucleoside-diphosphate-sugar epimerase